MTLYRSPHSTADQTRLNRPLPSLLPQVQGIALGMQCRNGHACSPASADLFDAVSPAPTLAALLLMNVSRHSEGPLHLLALAQDVFRIQARDLGAQGIAPQGLPAALQTILQTISAAFNAAAKTYQATALLAVHDTAANTLTYISAGAQPLLVRDGHSVAIVDAKGAPLASTDQFAAPTTHPAQVRVLPPGAAFVFVTPGLVGAHSKSSRFGIEGASAALASQDTSDPVELCRALVAAALRVEAQPSRFGPSLRIPGFREPDESDMTVAALVRPL